MPDKIKEEYIASLAYEKAKNALLKELFWEIGDYEAEMIVSYNNNQISKFKFLFGVHQEHYEDLLWNIDVVLMSNYNNAVRIPANAKSVCVDIKQI